MSNAREERQRVTEKRGGGWRKNTRGKKLKAVKKRNADEKRKKEEKK